MSFGKNYSYIVVTLGLLACVGEGNNDEMGFFQHSVLTTNALTTNALTTNALTTNALTTNALTTNALTTNGLHLNVGGTTGLELTEEGRSFLSYVTRCALPAGQSVSVTVDGTEYVFDGLLGLAPSWQHQPLAGVVGKQLMTACLLAHTNLFGVPVPISLRSDNHLAAGAEESDRFLTYEATYYGDLFSDAGAMYVCSGDAAPDFDVAYPNHDLNEGDRLLRRCSDPSATDAGKTECGFVYVGACSDVCEVSSENGHRRCWSNADQSGTRYEHTVSSWQLAFDDSASAWPVLYHQVYGQ